MEFYGKMSFLKAGMAYSSHITTVSATYAQEITTPDFGCGLDGFLAAKTQQGLLSGIPNGIDESWDAATDPHLFCPFSIGDWDGKAVNAAHVRELFGLDDSEGPLFAVVSRLVYQKGLDLTEAVSEYIVKSGGQIAIIGRGEPEEEQAMRELALRFPGQIGVRIGFNETDARRMFAGSDFLLMPSRYEPCGLSQMYAQRFGSLPVARNTGGLADTIEDGVTGFLFDESTVESYQEALSRAFKVFAFPDLLNAMRCRAMAAPFNWCKAVEPYAELYEQLVAKALGKSGHNSKRFSKMPLRTLETWPHGAIMLDAEHTRFALWAPDAFYVSVELEDGQSLPLLPQADGWFVIKTRCPAGTRYRYNIDGELEVPDPASRAQAGDIHQHSVVVDPFAYHWQHSAWLGRPWNRGGDLRAARRCARRLQSQSSSTWRASSSWASPRSN